MPDNTAAPSTTPRPPRRIVVVGLLLLLVISVPVVTGVYRGLRELKSWGPNAHWASHFNATLGDLQTVSVSSSSPAGSYAISLHGKAQFNSDETALTRLSDRLLIEGERDGVKRRWLLEAPTTPGALIHQTFTVNEKTRAPDAEDQRWMADMMKLVAQSVIDPADRVQTLLTRGGVAAVLADAEQGGASDFRRRALLEALLQQSPLDAKALQRVIAQAGQMGSDFDRRSLLQAVLASRTLSVDEQVVLLHMADGIGAAFERRQVLDTLGEQLAPTATQPALAQAWLQVVNGVNADFERRSVIEALMQRDPSPAGHIELALEASRSLQTAFEHRQVLSAIAEHLNPGTPAELSAYAESAARISTDFEHRQALIALLEPRDTLDRSSALAVLASAQGINTSFERMTLMIELARHLPKDSEVIEQYRQLARNLGDFERAQVEKALDPLVSPAGPARQT